MAAGIRPGKKTFLSSPKAKPSGMKGFSRVSSDQSVQPLKTRIYTKGMLRQDPAAFSDFGFGETGLRSTPSLLGMGRKR